MSPQSNIVEPAVSPPDAVTASEKTTRPVNWEKLQAELAPSNEVSDAVKLVFEVDAEILRELA